MNYDIAVVGGGPAGCTAALYGARFGRSVAVFEGAVVGGQMSEAVKIENYPAVIETDGYQLGQLMREQAEGSGAEFVAQKVTAAELDGAWKQLSTATGSFCARAVILATGARAKPLGLDRETALVGRGVSYCAACDGMLYRGKTVAVVGGGSSAVTEALGLAQLCKQVHLLHRRAELRAAATEQEAMHRCANLQFHPECTVETLLGAERLDGLCIRDQRSGRRSCLRVDGLFIAIGRTPATELFALAKDESGFLYTDNAMKTAISGVFVAGDVRVKGIRQITTAVSDGTIAAFSAEHYLKFNGAPRGTESSPQQC